MDSPEAAEARKSLAHEDRLVKKLIDHSEMREHFFMGENVTLDQARERAREFVGEVGNWATGLVVGETRVSAEIPTEFRLFDAERRIDKMLTLLGKPNTRRRRLAMGLLLPKEVMGRYPFLDATVGEQREAGRLNKWATKITLEGLHNMSRAIDSVLGTERGLMTRPLSSTDKMFSRGTEARSKWQKLAAQQAESQTTLDFYVKQHPWVETAERLLASDKVDPRTGIKNSVKGQLYITPKARTRKGKFIPQESLDMIHKARRGIYDGFLRLKDAESKKRDKLMEFEAKNPYAILSASVFKHIQGKESNEWIPDTESLAEEHSRVESFRKKIYGEWVNRYGLDGAGKLERLTQTIRTEQNQLFELFRDNYETVKQSVKLKLMNMKVSEKDADWFVKEHYKDPSVEDNYIHRIVLGPQTAARRRSRLWRDKTISEESKARLSEMDHFMEEWWKKVGAGEGENFRQAVERYRVEGGNFRLPFVDKPAGITMDRVDHYYGNRPDRLPFPDVLTAFETYGSQITRTLYTSHHNYAYENARHNISKLQQAASRSALVSDYERMTVRDIKANMKAREWTIKGMHKMRKADLIAAIREKYPSTPTKYRKNFTDSLKVLGDYISRHQHDILMGRLTSKDERWRNVFHSALAFETFAKIGFNLKTVTQNTSQLFMLFTRYGVGSITEGVKYMQSDEGKRILGREAMDFDSSTASYLIHTENQLFDKLGGVKPIDWSKKLLNLADYGVSKTWALRALGKSEMLLHKVAFATAFKRARDHIGADSNLKRHFEFLPQHIETMAANNPNFDRFAYLRRFGVTEADLADWRGQDIKLTADPGLHPEHWETKLEDFLQKKAIDVAHDARIFINGDYSTAGRPELFRTNWGKLIFQFKLFDVIFANYMGQSGKQFFAKYGRVLKGQKPRAAMVGEQRTKVLGINSSEEMAWAGRMAAVIGMLPILSGKIGADMTGWFEPGTVRLAMGMVDWYSGDDEKKDQAFWGKGPAGQFMGPAAGDLMDLVHWNFFGDLQKDDELSQFFFGTKVWDDLPDWKKQKETLRKFSSAAATFKYNALPHGQRGQWGQALWTQMFSPAYEERDKFKTIDQLRSEGRHAEATIELMKLVGRVK